MEEGLWGEKDGGKFGNELLDFGYGVGWFLARVWSGGGLEGQMEKGECIGLIGRKCAPQRIWDA